MNFKLELPEGTILINRGDLKEVLKELMVEVEVDRTDEEIMTVPEVAKYLKVSVPTVRNMMSKDIPFFQRGQVIRFNKTEINMWLKNRSRESG